MAAEKYKRRKRIRMGIALKIRGTQEKPRLSVFKSNKAIYAQIIDDSKGHTVAATSSKLVGIEGNVTIDDSKKVGLKIAEQAKAAGVNTIVFDRSGYKFHGQVKALADGAREGGLTF